MTPRFRPFAAPALLALLLGSCGDKAEESGSANPGGSCAADQLACGAVCVSITRDTANCGACGNLCAAGQSCVSGTCACTAELASCALGCTDPQVDNANCGACGVACTAGELCQGGQCNCQGTLQDCGGTCTDTQGDGNNCGACGTVCPTGRFCSAGVCGTACNVPGQVPCGTSCVDVTADPANCGACGTACAGGETCSGGVCGCAAGQLDCSGQCVDVSTSPIHCGQCGNACTGGQTCQSGSCTCPTGDTACSGQCTDLMMDPANCGSCGAACAAGQTCSAGQCTGGAGTGGAGTGGANTGGANTGGANTGGTATGGASSCGSINTNPFNCEFAWGAYASGNNYSYLDFVATWIGDEDNGGLNSWSATGTNSACGDCDLVETVAGTNSMVVFYAYFIGFQACRQGGFCDCNTDSGANLCSNGSQWIRDNRAQLVRAYGEYARAVYQRSPNKPVIWWLEGDFIQYSYADQQNPLSYAELGSLARDITCAIKSNAPNAVVAMNHSPWISDDMFNGFWGAQPMDVLDMVWVQGPGDSGTLTNSWGQSTANFTSLHNITGRPIMAETSYGLPDRWTDTTASNIDARISEGVIGVMINQTPSNFQAAVTTKRSQVGSTCQ